MVSGIGSSSYSGSALNAYLAGAYGAGATRVIPGAPRAAQPESADRADTTRPINPAERGNPTSTRKARDAEATPSSRGTGKPAVSTAYQTNADGDAVYLSSREGQLTEKERAAVEKLKQRDAEVRTHEQAHVAAAGGLHRGGPYYKYTTGPDGRKYATGGSVDIDTSPGKTPEETIQKAQQVQRAALAPAEPSAQDRAVAAEAARQEAKAKRELLTKRSGNQSRSSNDSLLTDDIGQDPTAVEVRDANRHVDVIA